MRAWSKLNPGQRCRIIVDPSSWDCGAQSAVAGGGPVGAPVPAAKHRRADIITNSFDGGMSPMDERSPISQMALSLLDTGDLYLGILGPSQNAMGMPLGDLDAGK
jgi:hypothetical protein